MERWFLLLGIVVILGCTSEEERRFNDRILDYESLRSNILEANQKWLDQNAEAILETNELTIEFNKEYQDKSFVWKLKDNRREFQNEIIEILLDSSYSKETKNSALTVLNYLSPLNNYFDNDSEDKEIKLNLNFDGFINALDFFERIEIYRIIANRSGFEFNIPKQQSLIEDSLCRAVNQDDLQQALILISYAEFDVGLLRCISGTNGYVAYKITGQGSCPVSLRRLSGMNYANKVSLKISGWQSKARNVELEKAKNYREQIKMIKGTFNDLGGPISTDMNTLLDKYNKWPPQGDCTLKR